MNTQKTVFAGLFVAMGVLLPIAFHLVGASGRIFLPMHIPVLMAGLLLGPVYGLAVGVAVPVVSSFFTGMPPVFPILPMMTVELAVYGFVAGIFHRKMGYGMLTSLVLAMIFGRGVCIVVLMLFGEALKIDADPVTYVLAGTLGGLAGIILQLILLPFIVGRLRAAFFNHELLQ